MPIIVMHKGRRRHVLVPGDKLMGSDQQEDEMIANVSAGVGRDSSTYQVGLNGPVILDYAPKRRPHNFGGG